MKAKEHPRECVKEWYSEPVVALSFFPNTSMCHGFEKIKGTRGASSANDTGYLLDRGSVDVCSRDAMLAINETIRRGALVAQRRCREGWFSVTVGHQTHCYRIITLSERKAANVSMSNIASVCKKTHPYSDAVSIHSSDENEALRSMNYFIAFAIGVRLKSGQTNHNCSSCWEWADGTPMDFTDWNSKVCYDCLPVAEKCGYVYHSYSHNRWTVFATNACDIYVPVLCKYTLQSATRSEQEQASYGAEW
uniref:C-type lectin domain-containing protein n=1 Tax=Steinernema glaseri TaxID=37863 RepID=A0A1I8AB34_9BILA